jgi:hypothetical protein
MDFKITDMSYHEIKEFFIEIKAKLLAKFTGELDGHDGSCGEAELGEVMDKGV